MKRVFLLFLLLGLFVFASAQSDKVEYRYDLLDENWTVHWIRPRIKYEMDIYPDWISIHAPFVYVGFFNELTKAQKANLDKVMAMKDVGLEPTNIKEKFTITITPDSLTTAVNNKIGKRMMYYNVNGNVEILFFDSLTITDIQNLNNALIWQHTTRKSK
jgi:hypothetical protein